MAFLGCVSASSWLDEMVGLSHDPISFIISLWIQSICLTAFPFDEDIGLGNDWSLLPCGERSICGVESELETGEYGLKIVGCGADARYLLEYYWAEGVLEFGNLHASRSYYNYGTLNRSLSAVI